jgi:hypothetical protein
MGDPPQNPTPNKAVAPDGTTRTIREPVVRRVWVAAGGRCTLCNRYLLTDDFTGELVFTGQLAHIVGWDTAEGSPRGDHRLPVPERNEADNLMLLCYDQHRVIDNENLWDAFGVDRLREFKRKHEHRIKQLTGLAHRDRTTVIRLVGTIHGSAVQLSKAAISAALLPEGRFPDYALIGVDEYEIDLRALPGETDSTGAYWQAAIMTMTDRLRLLRNFVAQETITDISVFAFARIPILIALGALLDDALPTTSYPKRRGGDEGWGWPATQTTVEFEWAVLQEGSGEPEEATIVFSISGSIETSRLPAAVSTSRIYEIRPSKGTANFDLVTSQATVDNFAKCWRALIGELETLQSVTKVNLVPAVPTTIAVAIGRHINRSVHPPMFIYDRIANDSDYKFTLELPR